MSFQTLLALSLTTEVVVMGAIVLTLLNAFTDGYLSATVAKLWSGGRTKPAVALAVEDHAAEDVRHVEPPLRRAA